MEQRELTRALAPQARLDLIMELDDLNDAIDVRPAVIYDSDYEKTIWISQTSPPVFRSMIGREIQASFIYRDRENNKIQRLCFDTKILEIKNDYEIRTGVVEPAVRLSYPDAAVEECAVRLFFRVEPSADMGYSARLAVGGESHLIDFSLGGAMLSYRGAHVFKRGETVKLELDLKGQKLALEGEARRVFEKAQSRMTFIGLKFIDVPPDQQRIIQEAINTVMRAELRERSGLAYEDEALPTPK